MFEGVIVTKHKPPAHQDNTSFRTRARVSVCRGWHVTSSGVSTARGTRGTVTRVSAAADTNTRAPSQASSGTETRARVRITCMADNWSAPTRRTPSTRPWTSTRCSSSSWQSSSSCSWSPVSHSPYPTGWQHTEYCNCRRLIFNLLAPIWAMSWRSDNLCPSCSKWTLIKLEAHSALIKL